MNRKQIILSLLFPLLASFAQAQVLYNSGQMYVGKNTISQDAPTALYIKGGLKVVGNSTIGHAGKTVLTGDFTNNVISGHVFSSREGVFEFRGEDMQNITGTADKAANYINFPDDLLVNNQIDDPLKSVVMVDTGICIAVKNLTFQRGRMVLDSKASENNTTSMAYLWTEDGNTIIYKHPGDVKTAAEQGFVQVNLDLGENYKNKGVTGFSSPYKTLYTDYFFYNFLSDPGKSELFSGLNGGDIWLTDPLIALAPGTGYVLGQALAGEDEPDLYKGMLNDTKWNGAKYDDRVQNKYSFARMLAPESFAQYNTKADNFTGEELNTADVTVPLPDIYNYLGNPFTMPIDLKDFALDKGYNVWVLTPNSQANYDNSTWSFTASFLNVSETGGTNMTGTTLIAPMQMFVVEKKGDNVRNNSLTIPLSARTHGAVSFLRSDDMSNEPVDELLIETEDGTTGGFDRLCVVFRGNGSLTAADKYDVEKLFNRTGGVNQIYTRSSDNKILTTNVIPSDTKELKMYFEPAGEPQEVTLKADRLNSLRSVSSVIIEDHKTGKLVDLTKLPSFTFLSSPMDKIDRFTLHFNSNLVGVEDIKTVDLSASYQSGVITVYGLADTDMGKDISLYNMQGQLLHKQVIGSTPLRIVKNLPDGIYMLRAAKNEKTLKLLVNN